MQSQPFKFRYINRIAGAFLFLMFAILAILIVLGAKSQHWFAEESYYRVELPVASNSDGNEVGTLGVKPGSDVRVVGSHVGYVRKVELCQGEDLIPIESFADVQPSDIRIVALLSVKGEFSEFVGPDSQAVLKFDLGGLGSAYFDLTRGTRRFEERGLKENPHILTFRREADAKEEVFDIVKRIENELVPAINSIQKTGDSASGFIEELRDKDKALYRTLSSLESGIADFNKILAKAEKGEGILGDLTSNDSQMRKEFNDFAVTLNKSSEDLEKAIANLDQGITDLREEGVNSFNEAAKNFPTTVRKTNATIDDIDIAARQLTETLREIEVLTDGLQNHWLVRGSVKDPEDEKPTVKRTTQQRSGTSSGQPSRPSSADENGGLLKRIFRKKDSN